MLDGRVGASQVEYKPFGKPKERVPRVPGAQAGTVGVSRPGPLQYRRPLYKRLSVRFIRLRPIVLIQARPTSFDAGSVGFF